MSGYTHACMIETEQPKAMTQNDIDTTIGDFVQATKNAMAAGFDGVEIHGAHGYLFDNFLRLASNNRTDQYGGSQQNRMRFLLQTLQAVVDAIGGHKVALRISPHVIEGAAEPDPEILDLTLKLVTGLAPMNLAYLHFSENIGKFTPVTEDFRQQVKARYPNAIMITGKQTPESAQELLNKGHADLIGFGTPFVTNPDLVARFGNNWPLTPFDPDARLTLYGGDAKGYTDYPAYQNGR